MYKSVINVVTRPNPVYSHCINAAIQLSQRQDWAFWNSAIVMLNVYPDCYSVIHSVRKPLLESLSHLKQWLYQCDSPVIIATSYGLYWRCSIPSMVRF
jgi:hypothetical protein